MGKLALRTIAATVCFIVGSSLIACSSSSSSATGGDGGGGGGGGGGGCSSTIQADLQALTPQPIASIGGDIQGACNGNLADGTLAIAVTIYNPDADQSQYNLQFTQGVSHPISGFGDEAYYNDGDQTYGTSGPNFHAHKGDATCQIDSNGPPNTTMKTSAAAADAGSTTGYSVAPADELAYVQLLGKTCNDVFAAL